MTKPSAKKCREIVREFKNRTEIDTGGLEAFLEKKAVDVTHFMPMPGMPEKTKHT